MAYQTILRKEPPLPQEEHQHHTVSYEEISCCITRQEDEDSVFVLKRSISHCQCTEVRICTMCYTRALIEDVQSECGDQLSRPTGQVGRQLAMIGDDINDRYAPQFNSMIKSLNLSPNTAYEAFAGIARKLFREGNISWGRIITLLCFGYRIAITVLQRGIRGFFSKIVGFVCRFIVVEKIAKWIAEQGGWRAVLNYVPETIGWGTIAAIMSVAAVSVVTAFFLARKQ